MEQSISVGGVFPRSVSVQGKYDCDDNDDGGGGSVCLKWAKCTEMQPRWAGQQRRVWRTRCQIVSRLQIVYAIIEWRVALDWRILGGDVKGPPWTHFARTSFKCPAVIRQKPERNHGLPIPSARDKRTPNTLKLTSPGASAAYKFKLCERYHFSNFISMVTLCRGSSVHVWPLGRNSNVPVSL